MIAHQPMFLYRSALSSVAAPERILLKPILIGAVVGHIADIGGSGREHEHRANCCQLGVASSRSGGGPIAFLRDRTWSTRRNKAPIKLIGSSIEMHCAVLSYASMWAPERRAYLATRLRYVLISGPRPFRPMTCEAEPVLHVGIG
jgi:hypothetical protein